MLSRPLTVLFVTLASAASAQPTSAHNQLARELYAELVNIDTSSKAGTTRASKRVIPGEKPADILRTLERVVDDPARTVRAVSDYPRARSLRCRAI